MAVRVTAAEHAWRRSSNLVDPFLTPEQDAKEAALYMAEPMRFFRQGKIKNVRGDIVLFVPNRPQRVVYSLWQKDRAAGRPLRCIIPKARKVGISTLIALWMYFLMRFYPRSEIRLLAHLHDTANTMLDMIRLFHSSLPENMRPQIFREKNSGDNRYFELGNKDQNTNGEFPGLRSIVTTGTERTPELGRGKTYRGVQASEVAAWANLRELSRGMFEAVPTDLPDSLIAKESTPVGAGGQFYHDFMRAREGRAGSWRPIFLPSFLNEAYSHDLTPAQSEEILAALDAREKELLDRYKLVTPGFLSWRREKIRSMGGSLTDYNAEFPEDVETAFRAQGKSCFELPALEWYMDNTVRQGRHGNIVVRNNRLRTPDFVDDPNGEFIMYAEPEEDEEYYLGADAAEGKRPEAQEEGDDDDDDPDATGEDRDRDRCAIVVLNSKLEQVAEYASNAIDAFSFADLLATVGYYYNCGMIMPEVTAGGNSAGFAMATRLRETNYPKIGRWEKDPSSAKKTITSYLGYEVTSKTKPELVGMAQWEVLRGAGPPPFGMLYHLQPGQLPDNPGRLVIRSEELINEMTTFVKLARGSVGARAGMHDDRVIALMLALKGRSQYGGLLKANVATQRRIENALQSSGGSATGQDWLSM